ncbi:MAG: tail fiber domain-containing protein, partial [Elusimicrobiota bacterium]
YQVGLYGKSIASFVGTGRVGIGETAPESAMEITSASPIITLHNSTNQDTNNGRESRLEFKGQQSGGEETSLARLSVSHSGTSDDEKGQMVFRVNDGNDGATPSEKMRITDTGNVGIATSIPIGRLQVSGDTVIGGGTSLLRMLGAGTSLYIQASTAAVTGCSADIIFSNWYQGYPGKLVIKAGGNIGVGTLDPAEKLEVIGDIKSSATVQAPIGDFDTIYVSSIVGKSPVNFPSGIDLQDTTLQGLGDLDVTYGITAATAVYSGAVSADKINTGYGDYELYAMDQDLETGDAVTFATLDTGQGAHELYAMDQDVESGDSVTFSGLTATYGVSAATGVFSGAVSANRINVATVAATSNQGLRLQDDGGNLGLFVEDGGYVGIGTTNPSEALHVIGDILASATVQAVVGDFSDIYVSTINTKSPLYINNGANDVLISGSGNIGIGTVSTISALHIEKDIPDGGAALALYDSNMGVGDDFYLKLGQSDTDGNEAEIGFTYAVSDYFANRLDIGVKGGGRLSILNNGNIGIGTQLPKTYLNIKSPTTGAIVAIEPVDWFTQYNYAMLKFGAADEAEHYIKAELLGSGMTFHDSDGFNFSGGNVGIGTTNPIYDLEVNGDIAAENLYGNHSNSGLTLFSAPSNAGAYAIYRSSAASADAGSILFTMGDYSGNSDPGCNIEFRLGDNGSVTDLATLTREGNLGIGITNPQHKLHVKSSSTVDGEFYGLHIQNPSSIDTGHDSAGILFGAEINNAFGKGALIYERTGTFGKGSFHFLQNTAGDTTNPVLSNAVMTIKNDGNVGIGTTDPISPLMVQNNLAALGRIARFYDPTMSANDSVYLELGTANSAKNTAQLGFIYAGNGSNSNRLDLGFNSVQAMSILAGGNVGIGTTNPAQKLEVDGQVYAHNAVTADIDQVASGSFVAMSTPEGNPGLMIGYGNGSGGVSQRWDLEVDAWSDFVIKDNTDGQTTAMGIQNGSQNVYFPVAYNYQILNTNRDLYIQYDGVIGYISSSIRNKENIRPLDIYSNKIYDLRPVLFDYKDTVDENGEIKESLKNQFGLIAEEVEEVMPEIVSYNSENGQIETVNYSHLTPLLLNEVIKLRKENDDLKARIETLEEKL